MFRNLVEIQTSARKCPSCATLSGGMFNQLRRLLGIVRIGDHAKIPRHLVVERASRCVVGIGMPVHPRTACRLRSLVDRRDESLSNAAASVVRCGEQILQVVEVPLNT